MADIDKGLPVRSEGNLNQKVEVELIDPTTPSQKTTVDSDGNAHVEAHGNDPGGTDRVLKLSELGNANTDGDYDVSNNTKPASSGMIVHDRNATPDETHQNVRVTGVTNSTTHAADVALHDENGVPYSVSNPMPVSVGESEGEEIHDYNEGVDVAAGGTSEHTFVVNDTETFFLWQVLAGSSTRHKITLQIGDGAVSETFATKAVRYDSEKQGSGADIDLKKPIKVVGTANGTTVKVIRENRDDDDAASIHTTIIGVRV